MRSFAWLAIKPIVISSYVRAMHHDRWTPCRLHCVGQTLTNVPNHFIAAQYGKIAERVFDDCGNLPGVSKTLVGFANDERGIFQLHYLKHFRCPCLNPYNGYSDDPCDGQCDDYHELLQEKRRESCTGR